VTDVTDNAMLSHDRMAELLPDYASGALPEDESRLVEDHLAGCEPCRRELADILETISVIAAAGPPRPQVRDALMARLATAPSPSPEPVSPPAPAPIGARRRSNPQWLQTVAWATAALFLIAALALAGWNYLLQQELEDRDRIAGLITGDDTAHALTDSDLETSATGVMYVDPESDQALLVASGLAPLPSGRGYQIWLFTEEGQQVSAGFFPVDESGLGQALITALEPLGAYHAVALSAEPIEGSSAPTAPLALGGWIQ
jgi:anti-sigma-K factor RskA